MTRQVLHRKDKHRQANYRRDDTNNTYIGETYTDNAYIDNSYIDTTKIYRQRFTVKTCRTIFSLTATYPSFLLIVVGPHSVAKCSVTPEGPYRFKVTYIPVETGVYDIYVRWYNQEIDGMFCSIVAAMFYG